jgi:hypothetical protein
VEYPKGVGLEAKEEFAIAPHASFQYRIKYKSDRVAEQEAILKAVNSEIGTFIYKIKLKTKDENKRKVIQMSVEVGKTGQYELRLENPRKDNVRVHY